MLKLLPVVLIGLMSALLSQYRTAHDGNLLVRGKKDNAIWFFMTVVFVIFVGLRTNYNDTSVYITDYLYTPSTGSLFDGLKFTGSESTGYRIFNRIMRRLLLNQQTFVMIYALIDVSIPMWFIRKYAEPNNWFLSVFLYITTGIYLFNMAAIMQCTATAIALVGVDRMIRKKWFGFVFFILLAATFHTYALIFLLAPLLSFRPWSSKTYIMLGLFLIVGLLLPNLLGVIVTITSAMGESYDISAFKQAGVNIFRFLVVVIPVILSFISRKKMIGKTTRTDNIILNLCMLNAEIMFVALFGTANYFARLANYFLIFQVIALPWMLKFFDKRIRDLLLFGIYIGYLAYFIYANYFAYGIINQFDNQYKSVTIVHYLRIIYNRIFLGGA